MIRGSFVSRDLVKAFLVDAVECGRSSGVPVIWALRYPGMKDSRLSAIELLKYLTLQAFKQGTGGTEPTEASLALSCAQYQCSSNEGDYINLLAASLSKFRRVYILVDVELFDPDLVALSKDFSLPLALFALFRTLWKRGAQTVVKVALASYGSAIFDGFNNEAAELPILPVGARKRVALSWQIPGRQKVLRTGQLRRG